MNHIQTIQHQPHLHQALLNEILKFKRQAIVLLDAEAVILFCSETITSVTGFDPDELIGQTAFDFFHPADLPAARQQHKRLTTLETNTSAALLQIRDKEGHMIWVDVVVKNLLHVPSINALLVLLKNSSDAAAQERERLQAITDAKEQEREFLASELHDNINQIVTATKLMVDMAQISAQKEELLRLSSANLQSVAEEIRKLSYSMVSFDLREFGLKFAVDAFLSSVSKASGVSFQPDMEADAISVLTADQQLHVYRIIQGGYQ